MTVLHPIRAPAVPNMLRLAPSLYGATLFLSALLLFAVQPMFTKMVLPRLGGAPTVWSVAMVFFQAALLGGVIAAVAAAQGLVATFKDDDRAITVPPDYKANASVAVLARRRADLGELAIKPGWQERKPDPGIRIWTDDYSNVPGAILR
jgi:hypothetical protein